MDYLKKSIKYYIMKKIKAIYYNTTKLAELFSILKDKTSMNKISSFVY